MPSSMSSSDHSFSRLKYAAASHVGIWGNWGNPDGVTGASAILRRVLTFPVPRQGP